jgi:CubicO group peptidase (beta-lactamase class C family)
MRSGRDAARAAEKLAHAVHAAPPAQAPALSLAVARPGAVLWSGAYGRADLEFDVAATPGHLFRLGSVSKVLTATAAAKLVERGALDLEAPISRYLPDLPEPHRATTMKQLLTHRGGVRHYGPQDFALTSPGGAIYMRTYPTNADILALFINDPLVAPPGERVSYSSYGYTLASLVMEAAAGRPFLQLIDSEIARPFSLPSLVPDDPLIVLPERASGYMTAFDVNLLYGKLPEAARPKLTNGYANIPLSNPAYCWAGAGFLMTAEDCARFGAALLDSPATKISAAERALLFTPLTEAAKNSPPLGLGWRIDKDEKGRLRWHHAGATPGGRYGLVVYPEISLSIALAGNAMAAPGDVLGPSAGLADIFA